MRFQAKKIKANAVLMVLFLVGLMMVLTLSFFRSSGDRLQSTNTYLDVTDARYRLESAHSLASAKLERAMSNIDLLGRLQFVGGPTLETFNNLSNTYASNPTTAMTFFRHLVASQSYSAGGIQNVNHEFANFDVAFPSTWTDPDPSDDEFLEYRYAFTAEQPTLRMSPQELLFSYSYQILVRAYGSTSYSVSEASDRGTFDVRVAGRPFSQWSLLMHSMRNQNGSQLVFAGGNTSAQIQEVYSGPVHVNERPAFYGHPTFLDIVTSNAPEPWTYMSGTGYTGCPSQCPTFSQGKVGNLPAITLPSEIFNTLRLAAGDPSPTAATNNSAITSSELVSFVSNHATGTVSGASVPDGVYIPTNSSQTQPKGGIFIQGDADIRLNVVQGSSDFGSSYWNNIAESDRSCKFQKVRIDHVTSGIPTRDVFIADDPCNATYVFNADTPTSAPKVLSGRINGNIHVEGSIQRLGGESRTRPAIARDFGFNISALRDVRIDNDIQYEDVEYVTMDSTGSVGSTPVANPSGPLNGSGIQPTASDLKAKIPEDSKTILGIISIKRNVLIRDGAPANINLHAAIFAGNSAAMDASGLGCGTTTANRNGCGFGYEGWNTRTGMGTLKFFGGLSEYRDQTTGVLSSPPRGYASRWAYDTRLREDITPPAFPVSNSPQAFAVMSPLRSFRLVAR
jgi:hypothetical protein